MKKPKPPRLVTVAITTTITIIFWIFLTLYRVLTVKPAPSVDPALLEPLDATLDTQSLGKIKDRIFYEEGSFTPPAITTTNNAQPSPRIEPTATPIPVEPTEEDDQETAP